jgi:hypothetical protein
MIHPNLSGKWIFSGKPVKDGKTGSGQIEMTIRQSGTELTGHLIQTIDPWTQASPERPEETQASLIGRLYLSDHQPVTLVELIRVNDYNDFKAIFTGIVSPHGRDITGHVVNTRGAHGSFAMHKVSS